MSAATSLTSGTLTALYALNAVNQQLTATTTSLVSGVSYASPADIIVSSQLRSTLAYLDAQSSSLQRTSNITATADAAFSEISTQLTDAAAIAVELGDATISDDQRAALQSQLDSIVQSVGTIASGSTFSDQPLLDGSVTLNAAGTSQALPEISAATLGEVTIDGQTYTLADIGSIEDPAIAQEVIREAQYEVTTHQASVGAFQTYTVDSYQTVLDSSIIQVSAANSLVSDTDYVASVSLLSQQQILRESSLLVLSIINDSQKNLVNLLA
jgi:flagellin